jgi:cytochrome bd-type quinol oxidase subunit 1
MKNHFVLLLIFSILTSLVLTYIARDRAKERFKYFLLLFCSFTVLSILAGWLMYPFPF